MLRNGSAIGRDAIRAGGITAMYRRIVARMFKAAALRLQSSA